jgi:uncharacterized protein involved in response to NO
MATQFLHIQQPGQKPHPFALFNLGFRPFFLLAALFAMVSMGAWGSVYFGVNSLAGLQIAPQQWHAHEMLFGYAMAVIAGFLLTAVRNWTNVPTLTGIKLALLSALWLAARVLMLVAPHQVLPVFILDVGFNLALVVAVTIPLVQAKQWKQLSLVSKIVLLGLANACFYLGVLGQLEHGVRWGLYSGLYLILALIFVMARRVVPFFIERGVGYPLQLVNRPWVDYSSLVLMALFWLVDVFTEQAKLAAGLAALLFVVHAIRLRDWYSPGVWKKPLLWVLFLGYGAALSGFLLKALTAVLPLSPYLAVHAFAVGGIGLMTAGMMARVILGHTGRDIQSGPRWLPVIFIALFFAFVARVGLPLVAPAYTMQWVGLALAAWLFAFAVFLWIYAPMLIKPRVDGQPG